MNKLTNNCIFCKIAKHQLLSYTVYEDSEAIAFLDIDPINEGHILVIPKEHYLDINEIPKELLTHLLDVTQKIVVAIKKTYNPNGYSIMQNGGEFNDIGHFHLHIFPRYQNDGFGWKCNENEINVSQEIASNIRKAL